MVQSQLISNMADVQNDQKGRKATSTTPVDLMSPNIEGQMLQPRKLDSDAGDLMRPQKKKAQSSEREKADPLTAEKEKAEGNDDNDSFHRLYNKEIKVN